MNRELILAELKRSREALDKAIAYAEAESAQAQPAVRAKTIKIGDGRAVALLASLRDAGGGLPQREFEEACLRNCRTLVGAGGFIARGSILRLALSGGNVEYKITEKGLETVEKWEARYGGSWAESLENPDDLGSSKIPDSQKVRLLAGVNV